MLQRSMSGSKVPLLLVIVSLLVSSWAQDVDECNVPQRASGTSGLLSRVIDLKDTIGYAGLDSVLQAKSEENELDCVLNVAQMKNKWGRVVSPSADGAQAAVRSKAAAFADSFCPGFGLCAEVSDGPDADVWPLSTLTYLVVATNATEEEEGCDNMKTVHDYVKWVLTDATAADIAKELTMATMPTIVSEQALQILDEMRCADADGVPRLVKDRPTHAVSVQGGGSSLQGNLQTKLTNAFFQQSFVSIAYTASSSGSGRAALRSFDVHFAGSDSILDMSDPEFIRRGVKMIPAFTAAIALVHNLDVPDLVLSRAAVAGLFTGSITAWANPAIKAENPDALLPNDAVVRVVRGAKSGTTSALTKAIYSFAGLPSGAQLDYSLHPLQGSSLPDWPVPTLPYADGAVCNFRSCIKQICEPGQRLDVVAEACVPCAKGFFSAQRGQHTECEACPPGSFSGSEGNSKCATCDEFQYQDVGGQGACKPCPLNSRRFFEEVAVGNATVQEETPGERAGECKCLEGFWLPAAVNDSSLGGLPCEPCPGGATCAGFTANRQQPPAPKKDYWGDPRHPGRFIECSTAACEGGYRCAKGRKGRLCSEPEAGHFAVGRLWTPRCPSGGGARQALVACSLLVVVAFWFKLRSLCSTNLDAVAVVVGIVQAFYVISRMRLRWHPSIEVATAALAAFNLDVGFLGWQCALPAWDGVHVFFLQLLLPFILSALSAAVYHLRWFFEARQTTHPRDKNVRAKGVLRNTRYLPDSLATYLQGRFLSFVLLMYHTLVMYAAAPFVCGTEPDGETQFVALMPEVRCEGRAHSLMRIVAILYILLVLVPVPIYIARRLWGARKKNVLNGYDVMEELGYAYLKFRSDVPWWELVLLARKGLLGMVVVVVSVPMIQAVLAVLITNVAMCLELVYQPMVSLSAQRLEVAGLCASLAMAVSGMLFFPSLDQAVECVGAANLVAAIGDQCAANQRLKAGVAALLLAMLALLALLAVALSAVEVHARFLAERAALHMKAMMQRQRARMLGHAVEAAGEAEAAGDEGSLAAGDGARLHLSREESWSPVWDAPACWRGVAYRLGLLQASPTTRRESAVDPYTLRLCHVIQGYHLHVWERRMMALEGSAHSRWQRVREHVRLHREELAYIETDEKLARFATIFDHVSGFYVNDAFANALRQLETALPLLIDWLAAADPGLRTDFSRALQSLAAFRRTNSAQSYSGVVLTEYRAPVVHWLMRCTEHQRQSCRIVFTAIAAASGLGAGNLVNLGLAVATHDDGLERGRDGMAQSFKGSTASAGSPLTSEASFPAAHAPPRAATAASAAAALNLKPGPAASAATEPASAMPVDTGGADESDECGCPQSESLLESLPHLPPPSEAGWVGSDSQPQPPGHWQPTPLPGQLSGPGPVARPEPDAASLTPERDPGLSLHDPLPGSGAQKRTSAILCDGTEITELRDPDPDARRDCLGASDSDALGPGPGPVVPQRPQAEPEAETQG